MPRDDNRSADRLSSLPSLVVVPAGGGHRVLCFYSSCMVISTHAGLCFRLMPTAMQVTLDSGVLALSLWEGFKTHHTINVTVIPGSSDGLEYVENVGIGEESVCVQLCSKPR